jgi:hypothetical protein
MLLQVNQSSTGKGVPHPAKRLTGKRVDLHAKSSRLGSIFYCLLYIRFVAMRFAVEPVNAEASNRQRIQPDSCERPDAYRRLSPFTWSAGLLLIVALLAASFFLVGYFIVYWRNADMDFMVVYNVFLLNDGQPQFYFDHPAYFTILLVKGWFRFLH